MRQRKIKNEDEKLAQYEGLLLNDPKEYKGYWKTLFGNDNPVCLELGCGKGQFITKLAMANPQINYIGIEGQRSVVLRALQKWGETILHQNIEQTNIRFIGEFIKNIEDYFAEGELSALYLNFSDPWPKDRHSKRRLTHTGFLKGYKTVLKKGAFIEFKSDNKDLFQFTMEEFKLNSLEIVDIEMDLHNSELSAKNLTTEYEDKFKAIGKSISYCRVRVNI